MKRRAGWRRYLRFGSDPGKDVLEELQAHIRGRAEQLQAQGIERRRAIEQAQGEFGDLERWRQACLETVPKQRLSGTRRFLESAWQDLRGALRGLRRHPGLALCTILLLATVLAVNGAVLAILRAYLQKELPYPESDRVVRVLRTPLGTQGVPGLPPVPGGLNSMEWPRQDEVMEYSAAWEWDGFGLLGGKFPQVVDGAWVTPGFFPILGARPAIGRVFTDQDLERNAAVAVISHSTWQNLFGADPGILGRRLTVYSNDRPEEAETFQVIGVLPVDFWSFISPADLLLPLRGTRRPSLLRLQRGVTPEQAEMHLTRLARQHLEVHPDWRMAVVPLRETLYASIRPSLRLAAATAFLVLLIAAGNLSVLMLIRSLGRRHEFAVRCSLGAARWRILRQISAESLLTAWLAVGLAVLLAAWTLSLATPLIEQQIGRQAPGGSIGLDIPMVGLILAMGLLCALFLGIGPAWTLSALRVGDGLRGRGLTQSGKQRSLRNLLVSAEIALSLTLLTGAGLMLRSTSYLHGLPLGFESSQLLKASLALRERSYPHPSQRIALFDQILQRLQTDPLVEQAALTSLYPFQSPRPSLLETEDSELQMPARAVRHSVSEGYFRTLQIPLLQGRLFNEKDRMDSLPVAVISDRLARQLWPGSSPIGKRLRLGSWKAMQSLEAEPWRSVVGVAGEVRQSLTEENFPDVYLPCRQEPVTHVQLMLRTLDTERLTGQLPAIILEIDPDLPLSSITTMQEVVDSELSRPRFMTGLLTSFSLFALLLAAVGVFTVVSFAAAQRRRETAIRIALGATPGQVSRLFVRQSRTVVLTGVVLGLIGGGLLATAMSSQLYGILPLDPSTHLALALITVVVTSVAIWIPSRKATQTDPVSLLRGE